MKKYETTDLHIHKLCNEFIELIDTEKDQLKKSFILFDDDQRREIMTIIEKEDEKFEKDVKSIVALYEMAQSPTTKMKASTEKMELLSTIDMEFIESCLNVMLHGIYNKWQRAVNQCLILT